MKKLFIVLSLVFYLSACEPTDSGRGGRVNTSPNECVILEHIGGSGHTT